MLHAHALQHATYPKLQCILHFLDIYIFFAIYLDVHYTRYIVQIMCLIKPKQIVIRDGGNRSIAQR